MDKLPQLLSNFKSALSEHISRVWAAKNLPVNLGAMTEGATVLSRAIVEVGDYCHEQLARQEPIDENSLFNYYWINFDWVSQAKSFMILWRDILFQQQKAQILKVGNKVGAEALRTLNLESKETLLKAIEDLETYVEKASRTNLQKKAKAIEEWHLQNNPWPIYREQVQSIPDQCSRLLSEHKELHAIAESFQKIERLIHQTEHFCANELKIIRNKAQNTLEMVEEETIPKLGKIAAQLEGLEASINLPNHLDSFSEALDVELNSLPRKAQVPVSINEGMVEIKDINFKRNTTLWLESEILPILYELWELTENAYNGLKMSLLNIRNKALLLSAEAKEADFQKEDICQPLYAFLKKLSHTENDLKELKKLISSRLENNFTIASIYSPVADFLPIPLQSAINQFKQNQNRLQTRIQAWLKKQGQRIQNFKEIAEQEDALSYSEKIVRVIKDRAIDISNNHYTNIFLTRGYIGESFWLGREKELQHAKNIIDNWKLGFRGAIIITGQRFAGKTLFGELVAHHFFADTTVRVAPNTLIKLNGRQITTTFDLKEALDFVIKYALTKRPLVWIDDLELWRDANLSLSKNVRILKKSIDNYADDLFFMVSMSNWLHAHLQLFHETTRVFQAEINVDRMSSREIREAILIRHGATHKILVNEMEQQLSAPQFQKMADKIYKEAEGNIGEALNRWSYSTKKVDEEKVFHQASNNYGLPNFLNPESAILLASIMLSKRTNEYQLRKLFGPPFTKKYAAILKRLISVGLLKRQLDGWLEINESIVNDLGRMLEERGYLKFHKQ